jgi:hypothetical protein
MGLLTDIFAATDVEANELALDKSPAGSFPCIQAKSLDPVKFCTLENILVGTETRALVRNIKLLRQASDDGPWVFSVSRELFGALSTLDDGEIASVAQTWSQTDELRADRWDKVSATDVLVKIVVLAKQAKASGRTLFVWACL